MKNVIVMMISAILGVLTLMVVMTMNGRTNRSMELQSSLPSVVESTLENMAVSKKYAINDRNEFLADMVEALTVSLDAASDIKVDVLECDMEKGLLSVRVTAEYLHPNGKTGTVTCERTAILEKMPQEETIQHTVCFYVAGELYKQYKVQKNDRISTPAQPQVNGKVFRGWVDGNGYLADFTQSVTQDISYFADLQ